MLLLDYFTLWLSVGVLENWHVTNYLTTIEGIYINDKHRSRACILFQCYAENGSQQIHPSHIELPA